MAIDPHTDNLRLRTALRDLVALSTIPAAWVGREPPAIAMGLADVLVGSLHLDFAFVRLYDPKGGIAVEVTRGNAWQEFPEWLQNHYGGVGQFPRKEIITEVGGDEGPCRGVVIPIGVNAEGGLVAAACVRTEFPTEIDRLLLTVAANHAATAFQSARLIHERKRAEEELLQARNELEMKVVERTAELRRATAELETILDASPVGIALLGIDRVIRRCNPAFERIVGWSADEIKGRSISLLKSHLDNSGVFTEKLNRGEVIANVETRLVRKDGSQFDAAVACVPLVAEAGGPAGFVAAVADISDRKSAEEARRLGEAYLAEAQRLGHTGSWAWNAVTKEILHSSEEHTRLYGFDPSMGVPPFNEFRQRIHPEDRKLLDETFARALGTGANFELEFRIVLPDGMTKYMHGVGHPVFKVSGHLEEFVGTLMDVTERKLAEEALHKAQAELAHVARVMTMGELASSIAHEVNQPLAAVIANGNACMRWLAGDPPNLAEARESLMRIVRDGKRASEVIARIRALVKKSALAREQLDLNETIQEVLAMANAEARRHRIWVRTELATGLPPVRGDRVQLQQVILNLEVNGIEAMKTVTDRPRELLIRSQPRESGEVLVAIQDSGIGIDPQNVERLFEAFYSTKSEGMGMGLSISRSIIEAHGGRLWATAGSGYGAIFQFTLPTDDGDQQD